MSYRLRRVTFGKGRIVKQDRLTSGSDSSKSSSKKQVPASKPRHQESTRFLDFDASDFKNSILWPVLVETVHSNPRFANLTQYTRETVLPVEPDIGPRELASRLSISVGEALVILSDLKS
jgi:hypothetical protein